MGRRPPRPMLNDHRIDPPPRARENPVKEFKTSGFLMYVTVVGAVAGFLYGYDTGIISGALLHIKVEYQLGHRMQEMVTSSILVGAILGALIGGWSIERIGRRWT